MSIPTRQALPPESYLILLGASLCVFNSNNAFVIENILRTDRSTLAWHDLIDLESGQLKPHVARTITKKSGDSSIASLFNEIVSMRNRIIHSFQITAEDGTQMLATKVKKTHEQFRITEGYLVSFLEKNERLSSLLHKYRGF
ncbi:selenium binding protein [Olsenella uli]|nr:selenium binding protein [Olsenella uli]